MTRRVISSDSVGEDKRPEEDKLVEVKVTEEDRNFNVENMLNKFPTRRNARKGRIFRYVDASHLRSSLLPCK